METNLDGPDWRLVLTMSELPTPLIDDAIKRLNNALRAEGGMGYWLMVIMPGGRSVSFKAARKEIDGDHFYAHLLGTLNDDVKQDLAPYLKVRLEAESK